MIASLLIRYGLGWLAPYLLPALIGLLLGGGGLTAWLNGWTDYKSAIILVGATGAGIVAITTDSKLIRAAMVVVIIFAVYYKGRVDEGLLTEQLVVKARNEVHAVYKKAADEERQRQEQIKKESEAQAAAAKLTWDAERARLRAELKAARDEATRDPRADQPAFSVDAVDRLNRLRHERKQPTSVRRPSGKAKAGKTSLLDDPPLPPLVQTNTRAFRSVYR